MSKRTKGGRVKNPPAVEVAKDMIGKNTICQFCHQVCFIVYITYTYDCHFCSKFRERLKTFCKVADFTSSALVAAKVLRSITTSAFSLGNTLPPKEDLHLKSPILSSQGVQRGKDEEGLNGFLPEDIRNEVKRGAGIKCDMCKRPGATIPCRVKKCKKNYHFTCGAMANPEHLFIFRWPIPKFEAGPK